MGLPPPDAGLLAPRSQPNLAPTLQAGVDMIGSGQTVTFVAYRRVILPLDGFVYWVRADLVAPGLVFGESAFASAAPGQPERIATAAGAQTVGGSLHVITDMRQNEDEYAAIQRVILTAKSEVNALTAVGPDLIYIGNVNGQRFAFSRRNSFYAQAGLWHYEGDAVPPAMASQVVDDPRALTTALPIVNNSLPLWLAFNRFEPFYPWIVFPSITLYPAFLPTANLEPPYATVRVLPESQRALAGAAALGPTLSRNQLVAERVRLTLYGADAGMAADLIDFVTQFTLDTEAFGLMNIPVPRDEHRPHPELGVLAMKKTIEFEINYLMATPRAIARQLILSAAVDATYPAPPPPFPAYEPAMRFAIPANIFLFNLIGS